mgnify:CR=1 FL=1
MLDNTRNEEFVILQNNLSNCVNAVKKTFYNKELIINNNLSRKQICLITYGKANIMKTDINGNTTILRDLKVNDIFSNLFFQNTEDDIYVISNKITEVIFIDYYSILKNCSKKCPFHNKKQNEKIELLSKRTVRERFLFFLKQRMNANKVFKVTTSYKAIAEYISVDRSNLMREINKLEKDKFIKKDKEANCLFNAN